MYLKTILFSVLLKDVFSANILSVMLVPSMSHLTWYTKYLEALLQRGHKITYVGVDRMKTEHQNLRQIIFDKLREEVFQKDILMEHAAAGPVEMTLVIDKIDHAMSNHIKKSDTFQKLLKMLKSETFDLMIQDIALCTFMLGAAGLPDRSIPVIAVTPYGRPSWVLDVLKNPIMYPSHPHFLLPYSEEMTFFERVGNYLFYWFSWGARSLYLIEQNKHAKDAFGENVEPLEKIMDKVHIVMVNSGDGLDFPYPKVPGLIHVGGLHIDPPKELSKDVKMYLDSANRGVIYFSLGTNVLTSNLAPDKIDMLKSAFEQLAPVKVLWKWEKEDLPGKPSNVKILKWVHQNDVLAHPNVVLFITHSGLLSTQEAVYHGVPVLGMPFALDQHSNLKKCMAKGFAESLDYTNLSAEMIVEKVRRILGDPKYKENVKRLSDLFRDTMERPLDRAVFWTEYAVRHKGAPHLSLMARKMMWYENAQLDVFLFLFLVILYILFIVYKALQYLRKRLKGNDYKPKTS